MYATIRIQMGHARHAALLSEVLSSEYQIIMAQQARDAEVHAFDVCIIDEAMFGALSPQIKRWKSMVAPLFMPVLLVCDARLAKQLPAVVWETVDEIVSMPVSKTELLGRLRVLLQARQSSIELRELLLEVEQIQRSLNQQDMPEREQLRGLLNETRQALDTIHQRIEQLATDASQLHPEQQALALTIGQLSADAAMAITKGLSSTQGRV